MLGHEIIEYSEYSKMVDEFNTGNTKNIKKTVGIVEEVITLPSGKTLVRKMKFNNSLFGQDQKMLLDYVGIPDLLTKVKYLDEESRMNIPAVVGDKSVNQVLFGFIVSKDGVVGNNTLPVKKPSRGWNVDNIIPMKMLPANLENKDEMFKDYELRSEEDGLVRYYVKKIKNVTPICRDVSGTKLPDYPDENGFLEKNVETLVSMMFEISRDDMAGYFDNVEGSIDLRRMSSITLLRGKACEVNVGGKTYQSHREIMGSNRININERRLGEQGKLTFIWKVYQL